MQTLGIPSAVAQEMLDHTERELIPTLADRPATWTLLD